MKTLSYTAVSYTHLDVYKRQLDKILDNISLNYESLKSLAETYGDMIDLQTNKNISRLTVVTV